MRLKQQMFQKKTLNHSNSVLKILEINEFLVCTTGTASFAQPCIDNFAAFSTSRSALGSAIKSTVKLLLREKRS